MPSVQLLTSDGRASEMVGGARWYDTYQDPVRPDYYATPGEAAISSDGSIAVVGAPGAAVGDLTGAGAAYVYERQGDGWVQTAKLVAPDAQAYDALGWNVAITGDGHDIVAGAPFVDGLAGVDVGAVYQFHGSGGTWSAGTKIVLEDGAAYDEFGWSVGIARHGAAIAVGAPGRTAGTVKNAGAVFVYRRIEPSRWAEARALPANEPETNGQFGSAVDLSADGTVLAATAATHRDAQKTMRIGEIEIIRSTDDWRSETLLERREDMARNSDGESTAYGVDVSVSDDGEVIALAAPDVNVGRVVGAGNALVYATGCAWSRPGCTTVRTLRPRRPSQYQYFASAVALDAAGTRLFLGNDGGGTNGQGEGELVTIERSNAAPVAIGTRVTFAAPNRDKARFGTAVALSADGRVGLATAPWLNVEGSVDQGGAYIVRFPRPRPSS